MRISKEEAEKNCYCFQLSDAGEMCDYCIAYTDQHCEEHEESKRAKLAEQQEY